MYRDWDIDTAKSYASEDNLQKALNKKNWGDHRHLVVCNRAGRYTAIFPASNIKGGYIAMYAADGFMTVG